MKSHRVAGQRLQEGTKFCGMGRNSIRLSIHPSVLSSMRLWGFVGHPEGSEGQPEGSEGQTKGSEGQLEGCEGQLEGSEG